MHTTDAPNTRPDDSTTSRWTTAPNPCPMHTNTTTQMGKALMASNPSPHSARTTQTGHPTRWPILLVSDASISACQTWTCTWVIWSTTQLWSSKGIVPSTTDNLYSRLAEAYSIYTVLQFFQTLSVPFWLFYHTQWLLNSTVTTKGFLTASNKTHPHCIPMIQFKMITPSFMRYRWSITPSNQSMSNYSM